MASTATTAAAARSIVCELSPQKSGSGVRRDVQLPKLRSANPTTEAVKKIILQPRLCTLRSYGPETRDAVVKLERQSDNTSQFFASLADYIESSKKSHDFETISGRLAMVGIY